MSDTTNEVGLFLEQNHRIIALRRVLSDSVCCLRKIADLIGTDHAPPAALIARLLTDQAEAAEAVLLKGTVAVPHARMSKTQFEAVLAAVAKADENAYDWGDRYYKRRRSIALAAIAAMGFEVEN